MKALTATILALMMALSVPAQADESYCDQISELAEGIMSSRQGGVSMAKAMEIAGDNKLFKGMMVDAYETGRYIVESNQRREIADFRDKWYLACYKAQED